MRYLSLWPHYKNTPRDFWRQFDDLFQGASDLWPREARELTARESEFAPLVDVEEDANSYTMHFDLPGVPEEAIKVEVKDNVLVVTGERKRESKTDGEIVRFERSFGRFERALTLPRNVASDKITAKYSEGVLTLSVPKSPEATTRVIEVKKI